MKKRLVAVLALAVAVVMMLASCTTPASTGDAATEQPAAQTQAPTEAPAADETAAPDETPAESSYKKITWNPGTEPPQLNTFLATDTISFTIFRHLYEGLTRLDANDRPIPGVAESWDISDDGLVYTFHLRDSVWNNGEPVTANDFAFAFERLLAPESAAEYAYFLYCVKGAEAYNAGTGTAADIGINVIDEKTLEITLVSPTSYFLEQLAFGVMMPVNEAFYNQVGAEKYGAEAANSLYNGPYVLSSWEHEATITMKKNPTYWNAAAIKIDEIEGLMIVDAQAAVTAFLAGELDMVGLGNKDYITQTEAQGFTTLSYNDGSTFYLQCNHDNPIMGNKKIRQAISAAINRQDYIDKIMRDMSEPAVIFTSKAIKGVTKNSFLDELAPSLRLVDNNGELAKQLFAEGCEELGIDPGSIEISMISDDGDLAKARCVAIAESLKQNLGIEMVVDSMPFKSRLEKMTDGDYQMAFAGWGPDYNDPMTFLDLWVTGGGNNTINYSSPAYDALYKQAGETPDNAARYKLYEQIEEIIVDDLPVIPIYFRTRAYTTSHRLTGVVRTAFSDVSFLGADVVE